MHTLVQRADVAMYDAKRSRTSIETYSSERDPYSAERLQLLGELRAAIGAGELVLHYQPKVDVVSERVIGVEALLRWQHPVHGLLPPVEFVPLAYDHERLAAEMRAERLPEEFVETVLTGWWTTCLEVLPAKERAAGRW